VNEQVPQFIMKYQPCGK